MYKKALTDIILNVGNSVGSKIDSTTHFYTLTKLID